MSEWEYRDVDLDYSGENEPPTMCAACDKEVNTVGDKYSAEVTLYTTEWEYHIDAWGDAVTDKEIDVDALKVDEVAVWGSSSDNLQYMGSEARRLTELLKKQVLGKPLSEAKKLADIVLMMEGWI